jgi:hypothetical protein
MLSTEHVSSKGHHRHDIILATLTDEHPRQWDGKQGTIALVGGAAGRSLFIDSLLRRHEVVVPPPRGGVRDLVLLVTAPQGPLGLRNSRHAV